MKKLLFPLLCLTIVFQFYGSLQAATLTALSTFGGGDGWIAPGDHPRVQNDNNQRGLAYNPVSGNVLLVSRTGGTFVQKFDGVTGADEGTLDVTGISGGTFALSTIGVASDGAIFAANLASPASSTSPYKIYRWDDEAATPTLAFSGAPQATRYGDTIDVTGSGVNTRIIAGHGTPANNFSIFTTADGSNFTGTSVAIPLSPAPGGTVSSSFRLGLTFTDNDTVVGRGDGANTRVVDIAAGLTTGTQVAVSSNGQNTYRPIDYTVLGNGIPILAMQQIAGDISLGIGTTSRLFIYDMTDPNNPVEIAQKSNTTISNANGNATGSVAIGKTTYRKAIIYSLDTNNGIQAFELTTVPEPTSLALCGLGLAVMGVMRGRRNGR